MARKLASTDSERRRTRPRLGRRDYLAGGLAAIGTLAGIGSTPNSIVSASDSIEREGIEFDQVLDAVDDLGMDPDGEESVSPAIQEIPADTLVLFPDGDYLIDERLDLPGLGNVGFEANGDATIVGAPGFGDTSWNVSDSDAVYYAGFTHDQHEGAVGHFFRAREQIEIHDIEVEGRGGVWGVELSPHITDPDGLARVVNYVNKEGSAWGEYHGSAGRIGCWLGGAHEGTIQFIDCDFREYGNNALYTSHCPGAVQVIDSYFENNNVASVRIGGEDSFVEDTTIVIDENRYTGPRGDEEQAFFLRGVLIEEHHHERGQKPAGAAVRGCDIEVAQNPTGAPAIEVWGNGRSLEIADTRIQYDNDGVAAVRREEYGPKQSHPPGEDPRWVRMKNCVITGEGSTRHGAVDIADGDGSEIRDTVIQLTGGGDGIQIRNSSDCVIEETTVDVDGDALALDGADLEREDIREESPDDEALAHPAD